MSDPKGPANQGGTPPSNDSEQTLIRGRSEFFGTKPGESKAPSRADRLMGRGRDANRPDANNPGAGKPGQPGQSTPGQAGQSTPGQAAPGRAAAGAAPVAGSHTPGRAAGQTSARPVAQQNRTNPEGANRPGSKPSVPGRGQQQYTPGRAAAGAAGVGAAAAGAGAAAGAKAESAKAGDAKPADAKAAEAGKAEKDSNKGKLAGAAGIGAGAGALAAKLRDRVKSATASDSPSSAPTGETLPNPKSSGVEPAGNAHATPSRMGAPRRTRKARLRLSQIDPWSVMKTAFLFSVAAGIVLWVATGTVWAVIGSSGLFEQLNKLIGDIIQTPGDNTFRIEDFVNTEKVMGTAALIGVIDVVIFTALATLGAFLYNLASAMIGGLEVTLAED